jgi:two-component system, cell cycle sensor histidine kinase and response regulator CckA
MSMVWKPDVNPSSPASDARSLRVLLIEDTHDDAELMLAGLKRAGYSLSADVVSLPEDFTHRLHDSAYDVIISDHNLRTWTGFEALEELKKSGKNIPFIVLTGSLGDEAAVDYLKRGAADYVLKHRLNVLPLAVSHVLKEKAHRDEKERLHQQIVRSKEEWERTFDSVPDAVFIFDNQCRVSRANRAAVKLLAEPSGQIIGMKCYEVIHGLSFGPPDCPHEQSLASGALQRADYEETRLGKTFDATSAPLRDASGNLVGCIHVLRDITDRHQAEQALRHSEERYRSLVAASSQVVWNTTSTGEMVEDSPTWREFTGQNMEDMRALGKIDVVHPEDRDRVRAVWTQAIQEKASYYSEFRVRRHDGQYRDVVDRGVPVLERDGAIREWIGTYTDITDQRQLEEQFRQAHKMEAMGRLAGGISHDFNNLLGVIIGYSDLLLTSPLHEDLTRHHVQEIKKAGQRAASLTRQLLAFSRKQVLTPKVLDLNSVVSETCKMLLRVLGEDIQLTARLAPSLGHVKADATQIEQVIMNLAINARDAMPHGGKLIIETANTELDGTYCQRKHVEVQPGNYALITVSDSGIGMDKEVQAHLFEPFYTTKENGKGTGLGLATVYGIIRQSGGYIWVYSEPGKGTTFKVYIPQLKGIIKEFPLESHTTNPSGSGTILLVEDEDALREISFELLKSVGYKVIAATSGTDAIRIAREFTQPIDLLVTDVVMPGMNGRELAELLTTKHPQMKVLYVSGHTDDVIVHYAILKPGMAFLQKPFTRDSLAKKVQHVLGDTGEITEQCIGAAQ